MNYMFPWGPPPSNYRGASQREIEKAVRRALQIKDHDKNNKRKRREEMMKRAAQKRQKFFTTVEIFILGVVCQPIVGVIFNIAVHKMQTLNP